MSCQDKRQRKLLREGRLGRSRFMYFYKKQNEFLRHPLAVLAPLPCGSWQLGAPRPDTVPQISGFSIARKFLLTFVKASLPYSFKIVASTSRLLWPSLNSNVNLSHGRNRYRLSSWSSIINSRVDLLPEVALQVSPFSSDDGNLQHHSEIGA